MDSSLKHDDNHVVANLILPSRNVNDFDCTKYRF